MFQKMFSKKFSYILFFYFIVDKKGDANELENVYRW